MYIRIKRLPAAVWQLNSENKLFASLPSVSRTLNPNKRQKTVPNALYPNSNVLYHNNNALYPNNKALYPNNNALYSNNKVLYPNNTLQY